MIFRKGQPIKAGAVSPLSDFNYFVAARNLNFYIDMQDSSFQNQVDVLHIVAIYYFYVVLLVYPHEALPLCQHSAFSHHL